MAFLSWDPLRGLVVLQIDPEDASEPRGAGFQPPVDLFETADAYVLMAELAGIDRQDVEIVVQDRRLTLKGRRTGPDLSPNQYLRIERGLGPFSRTFEFPLAIDAQAVVAETRNGVLTVTIPKAQPPEPRRVKVG